jgi:hypothetical protein
VVRFTVGLAATGAARVGDGFGAGVTDGVAEGLAEGLADGLSKVPAEPGAVSSGSPRNESGGRVADPDGEGVATMIGDRTVGDTWPVQYDVRCSAPPRRS